MTPKQYWEGDNALPFFYKKAYELKQESAIKEQNYFAWLQGMYYMEAIAACLSKNAHYPKEPYSTHKQPEPQTKEEEEQVMMNAAEGFAAFIFAKNKERQRKVGNQEQKQMFTSTLPPPPEFPEIPPDVQPNKM